TTGLVVAPSPSQPGVIQHPVSLCINSIFVAPSLPKRAGISDDNRTKTASWLRVSQARPASAGGKGRHLEERTRCHPVGPQQGVGDAGRGVAVAVRVDGFAHAAVVVRVLQQADRLADDAFF